MSFSVPGRGLGGHEGYLLKNSGGKKSSMSSLTSGGRRNSIGNALSKWERRYFVISTADQSIKYWKKAADHAAVKPPSGELSCTAAYVAVEGGDVGEGACMHTQPDAHTHTHCSCRYECE